MRRLLLAAFCLLPFAAQAQYTNNRVGGSPSDGYRTYGGGSNSNSHYVNPYTRSDGSSVNGHYRTNPDGNPYNNYGSYGNSNPNGSRSRGGLY